MSKSKKIYRRTSIVGTLVCAALFGTSTLIPGMVAAQDPVVYPGKGQSKDQQEKDKFECYSWSKTQTGYDPSQQQAQAAQPSTSEEGSTRKSTARGAAGGAIGGAIAGDAGKGAAIGAGVGGVSGKRKEKKAEEEQQEATAKQQSTAAQKKDAYDRAFSACMEGRGYTVK